MRLPNLIEERNHRFYGMIGEAFKLILMFLWSWLEKPKFRTVKHLQCFSRQLIYLRDFSLSLKKHQILHTTPLKLAKNSEPGPAGLDPLKMMLLKASDITNASLAKLIGQIFQHGHT